MKIRKKLLAVALAAAAVMASTGTVGATSDAQAVRLAGVDRYQTSQIVADKTFGQSTIVLLASGQSFPDALAAAYLSGAANAPILLTPTDSAPAGLTETLEGLGADGVQIIGGTAAVSGQVAAQVQAAGYVVDRIGGSDRYQTARFVAETLPADAVGSFGAGRAAIIATGSNFADALAAAPLSAAQNLPILLTTGGSLHPAANAALDNLGIEQVIIAGGTGAVSANVASQISAKGIAVRRVAGENRQQTAVALAQLATGEANFATDRVMLARGDVFTDALVGGARGGHLTAPILLTESSTALGSSARGFIAANRDTVAAIDVLGGTAAVSDAVASDAVATARG